MKVRKLGKVLVTLTPLLLMAGAAWAATSGVGAIDQPLNTLGHVAGATGYIVGGVGAVGIIHHIRSGSWLGAAEHLGLATFGGAIVYNYAGLAPIISAVRPPPWCTRQSPIRQRISSSMRPRGW